jgi:hypothetical protein
MIFDGTILSVIFPFLFASLRLKSRNKDEFEMFFKIIFIFFPRREIGSEWKIGISNDSIFSLSFVMLNDEFFFSVVIGWSFFLPFRWFKRFLFINSLCFRISSWVNCSFKFPFQKAISFQFSQMNFFFLVTCKAFFSSFYQKEMFSIAKPQLQS